MQMQRDQSLPTIGMIKLSKYFKPRYVSWLILSNLVYLSGLFTDFSVVQIITILIISITLLKKLKISWMNKFLILDSCDFVTVLARRIENQISNFVWLLNKINFPIVSFVLFFTIGLWFVEKYSKICLSWCILSNLLILYLGATRFTKSMAKYYLRLYREYKKYVIHVIEANSPDKKDKDLDFESEIYDLNQKQ